MRSLLRTTIAVMILSLICIGTLQAESKNVNSTITEVTVYSDWAKIVREMAVTLDEGDHTLLFENLPISSEASTFHAAVDGPGSPVILGLSLSVQEHLESPQDRAAVLENKIRNIETNRYQVLSDRLSVYTEKKNLLLSISKHAGESMADDLKRGGINSQDWDNAYQFFGDNLADVVDSMRLILSRLDNLSDTLQLLRKELGQVRSNGHRRTRTVKVDIRLAARGEVTVTLDYVVTGATWEPLYNARMNADGTQVELEYMAEVSQKTGEDWQDVDLILSTSQPSFGAGPGDLLNWVVTEYRPPGNTRRTRNVAPRRGKVGKIMGTVVDAETKEPIPGAYVMLVGTALGDMTDINGKYIVSLVPPGMYTLRITSTGYDTYEIGAVNVVSDLTTKENVYLTRSVTDLGKTLSVTAKKKGINKYVHNSKVDINRSTIECMPVQNVDQLLQQTRGVITNDEGRIVIRGGRVGEIAYITDGVQIVDPLGGYGPSIAWLAEVEGYHYSTNFKCTRKETVLSGGDAIRAPIARWNLEAKTDLICRSRQSQAVFRRAEIINNTGVPLLRGPVNIFAESDFVGEVFLGDFIVPNQTFQLPFGPDSRISVKRQIVASKKSVDGKKIKIYRTVEIKLKNWYEQARNLTLEEPFPVSRHNKIKVKTKDVEPEPDDVDKLNRALWKITLQPGEEKILTATFEIEYPRNMRISGI